MRWIRTRPALGTERAVLASPPAWTVGTFRTTVTQAMASPLRAAPALDFAPTYRESNRIDASSHVCQLTHLSQWELRIDGSNHVADHPVRELSDGTVPAAVFVISHFGLVSQVRHSILKYTVTGNVLSHLELRRRGVSARALCSAGTRRVIAVPCSS